jgi:protein involved in polysaccharide export with SLBB domain
MMQRSLLSCLLLLLLNAPLAGQTQDRGWDPTGLQLSRAELEQLLSQFEETASSSAYSGSLRSQARDEANLIRQRLAEGDLRVGDQITLVVEGQQALTGTFTVVVGPKIVLPEIGEVPMTGVLRSELQPYLTSHLSRFLVSPVVHARSLIRIEILGMVGRPGFYMIPSDMLLSETLMQAGGPGASAALDKVKIQRGKEVIWKGDRLREAMIEGRTLDQLSIRAGDGIHVPASAGRFPAFGKVMGAVTTAASFFWLLRRTRVI